MIQANFQYDGEIYKAKLPSSWAEMKVRHYLALETIKNPVELIATLSDIDLSKVLNTKTDLMPLIKPLINMLKMDLPDFRKKGRRTFQIDGKKVKIPSDFSRVTFGQNAMIEKYLAESEGDERRAMLPIMGVVLQPLLDKGPFNLDRAKYYEKLAGELPIKEVFPNVFFFWKVLKKSIIIGLINSNLYQ